LWVSWAHSSKVHETVQADTWPESSRLLPRDQT
jgi:hypothetical protein